MIDKIGVTKLPPPPGGISIDVYIDPKGGSEVFETDVPYLVEDGVTLFDPAHVVVRATKNFLDANGNYQTAISVTGLAE